MKTIVYSAIIAATLSACGDSSSSSKKAVDATDTATVNTQPSTASSPQTAPIGETLTAYLQIKNALVNDNGKDAATGGNAFVEALAKIDQSTMKADQKKSFEDVADDAKEMAEHIGKNAGKIDHQREHFDMLSKDMYDMVKAFGAGQTLYQDFCPMFNNNKGATWLSETKEIQNPYMGKKQPTCGSVKEELK